MVQIFFSLVNPEILACKQLSPGCMPVRGIARTIVWICYCLNRGDISAAGSGLALMRSCLDLEHQRLFPMSE